MHGGEDFLALGLREIELLRGFQRGRDVLREGLAVTLRDEGAALRIRDCNEVPRLAIAAARRERAGLADLADQRHGHRIRLEAPNRARRAQRLEQSDLLADRGYFGLVHGPAY